MPDKRSWPLMISHREEWVGVDLKGQSLHRLNVEVIWCDIRSCKTPNYHSIYHTRYLHVMEKHIVYQSALSHVANALYTWMARKLKFMKQLRSWWKISLCSLFRVSCTWKASAAWRRARRSSLPSKSHPKVWSHREWPDQVASTAWAVSGDPKARRSKSGVQRGTGTHGWTGTRQEKYL